MATLTLTEEDYMSDEAPDLTTMQINTMLEDFNVWQTNPKMDALTQSLKASIQLENLKKSLAADRKRLEQLENKIDAYVNDIKASQRQALLALGKSFHYEKCVNATSTRTIR